MIRNKDDFNEEQDIYEVDRYHEGIKLEERTVKRVTLRIKHGAKPKRCDLGTISRCMCFGSMLVMSKWTD